MSKYLGVHLNKKEPTFAMKKGEMFTKPMAGLNIKGTITGRIIHQEPCIHDVHKDIPGRSYIVVNGVVEFLN